MIARRQSRAPCPGSPVRADAASRLRSPGRSGFSARLAGPVDGGYNPAIPGGLGGVPMCFVKFFDMAGAVRSSKHMLDIGRAARLYSKHVLGI